MSDKLVEKVGPLVRIGKHRMPLEAIAKYYPEQMRNDSKWKLTVVFRNSSNLSYSIVYFEAEDEAVEACRLLDELLEKVKGWHFA